MILTLAKSIHLANDRSQDEKRFRQVVDQVDGHAAGTDEEISDGQVHQVEVDRRSEGPVEGNDDDDPDVAQESDQHDQGCHRDLQQLSIREAGSNGRIDVRIIEINERISYGCQVDIEAGLRRTHDATAVGGGDSRRQRVFEHRSCCFHQLGLAECGLLLSGTRDLLDPTVEPLNFVTRLVQFVDRNLQLVCSRFANGGLRKETGRLALEVHEGECCKRSKADWNLWGWWTLMYRSELVVDLFSRPCPC